MEKILSEMPLDGWRSSLTIFKSFFQATPVAEVNNGSWEDAVSVLSPPRPAILANKKDGQYFVPCLLKEAPLTGNTLELASMKGLPTIGKMRSANHVTESSWLLADIDGLSEHDVLAAFDQLKSDGISYIAYTTHSHGSREKPGMRVRIAIPNDRAVSAEEYTTAWYGLDQHLFNGQLTKADASSSRMYQQQGTWSCHPSRISHARSWRHDAGIASADFLINIGRPVRPQTPQHHDGTNETPASSFPLDKLIELLNWIDPDITEPRWFRIIGAAHKATHGSYEGLQIVDAWSSSGGKYKGYRDVEKRWNYYSAKRNCINIGTLIHEAKQAGANISSILRENVFEAVESEEPSDEGDLKAPLPLPDNPMETIQQMFGLINVSGKLWVYDRAALAERTTQQTHRKLQLSSRSDGGLLIERALLALYPDIIDEYHYVARFFRDPGTVCYSGIEFNPKGTSPNFLNLWEGPTIDPVPGTWLLIQEFLFNVICNGDNESYIYLLKYIAHALQKPEEKPGVMVILIGGQGIGKGTLGRILQKIWSATYIQVNNIDAVVGTFNAILERAYVVFMDEALFAGNRRGTDELKSIVTEPIIQISEKYQPSRQIRSVHRFIAATNADHFKNTERDDRRDFTLRVSEERKGDLAYWTELNTEIEYGGVEAMMHDLLHMDLSGFNVRNKPNTRELIEQKIHSLDPIQRWWHDLLYCADWPDFISTQEAIEGIIEINGGRMHKKPSAVIVSQALHKLCPSARSIQKTLPLGRHRGYSLPPLGQARAEFEKFVGGPVEWPEVESAEVPHSPLGSDSASCAEEAY